MKSKKWDKSIQRFQRYAFRKVWTQLVANLTIFFAQRQAHMRKMGKWPWQCTTTGLDNSTELRTEQIRRAVTEIWVPQVCQPPVLPTARPPAWTVMTIPLQPGRLRGKNTPCYRYRNPIINLRQSDDRVRFIMGIPILLHPQVFHAACAEIAHNKQTLQSPPTLSWHPYKRCPQKI